MRSGESRGNEVGGWHQPVYEGPCDNEEFGFYSEGKVKLLKRVLKRGMAESDVCF